MNNSTGNLNYNIGAKTGGNSLCAPYEQEEYPVSDIGNISLLSVHELNKEQIILTQDDSVLLKGALLKSVNMIDAGLLIE